MINKELLNQLVKQAMELGADWCDLYIEDTFYTDLLLRDGVVGAGGTHIDFGCGIRVLKGEKTGYAYSESLDYDKLMSAVKSASAIAQCANTNQTFCAYKTKLSDKHYYPDDSSWRSVKASSFIPFLEKIEKSIRTKDSRALNVIASLSYSSSEIEMYNSLGELTRDIRPLFSLSVQTIFVQNDRSESSVASKSLRIGPEALTDSLVEEIALAAVKDMDARFEAKRPKGGQMSVVMGAGASGILLHEAMGHSFEADFIRKGQSIFCDKLGKQICRKGINIVDDGTILNSRGSINYDDEGIESQKTYMVKDGVLNSFLHDRISASYFGVQPTGNGRRESFRYKPIPRMRTTYMESGNDGSVSDLIASVKKGVFVDQFSNGEVKIGEGDFTFYVKSGYLIENGKLTMPIKDVNIIGNGPKALSDIVAVASDLKIDEGTWTCGKEQSVAVSCGMPSVLINKLTVGGE